MSTEECQGCKDLAIGQGGENQIGHTCLEWYSDAEEETSIIELENILKDRLVELMEKLDGLRKDKDILFHDLIKNYDDKNYFSEYCKLHINEEKLMLEIKNLHKDLLPKN